MVNVLENSRELSKKIFSGQVPESIEQIIARVEGILLEHSQKVIKPWGEDSEIEEKGLLQVIKGISDEYQKNPGDFKPFSVLNIGLRIAKSVSRVYGLSNQTTEKVKSFRKTKGIDRTTSQDDLKILVLTLVDEIIKESVQLANKYRDDLIDDSCGVGCL